MGYTVAQANLYINCAERIEARRANDMLAVIQLALFGKGES